jgi:hypothetical protein
LARYTDDLRAAMAVRGPQARHDNDGPADADGFSAADHCRELKRCVENLSRAIDAGVPGSSLFEIGQASARLQAIAAIETVREMYW